MRFKKATIGLVLAGITLGSTALTLGRARGAAWIGQPLELVVPVQQEAGQASTALCAEADVFYADSKQDAGRVQVRVDAGATPETGQIRVTSSSLIDEPVVTVYLRVGCTAKTTRRFVLLADFPSEPAAANAPVQRMAEAPAPVPLVTAPAAVSAPVAVAPLAAPAETATPSDTKASETPASSVKAPQAPSPAKASPKPAPKKAVKPAPTKSEAPKAEVPKAAASNRPRLKLDPIENLSERIKTLEATTTAVPLEEMVKDSQRIQQLQGDIKTLLDQATKNDASLLAMRERLEKAESDRVPAWLVYILLALVLLCLGAIAVLWNRRDPSAWRAGIPGNDAGTNHVYAPSPTDEENAPANNAPRTPTYPARVAPVRQDMLNPEVDVTHMDVSNFDKLEASVGQFPTAPPQTVQDSNVMHANFTTDRMFDLCQQADFFAKLGKTDDAIEALEKRIRENPKDCPLVYLDLLRIANANSLKTDFRQFRDEFSRVFNANVPEFALFKDEGRSLEEYPDILSHIMEIWPSPSVMNVVEACILRTPGERSGKPFDLAAFRDLVMLHGIIHTQTYRQEDTWGQDFTDLQHVDLAL